ncbi:hypothetical protein V6N13_019976 [Hibiscus sabdariffa]|uniref:Uncharacterized protein n=1 Tax=Hibiscus sabdariffa TaxID=183260 RepID=A0ABR2ES22_9ROSI
MNDSYIGGNDGVVVSYVLVFVGDFMCKGGKTDAGRSGVWILVKQKSMFRGHGNANNEKGMESGRGRKLLVGKEGRERERKKAGEREESIFDWFDCIIKLTWRMT